MNDVTEVIPPVGSTVESSSENATVENSTVVDEDNVAVKKNAKLIKLAENALVKMDNASLDFDREFAKFSKKEMDIAFIIFASFSSMDTIRKDDVQKSSIILQNQHIKELCGLYTKTRRISKNKYNEYVTNLKNFFRKAEFKVHMVIEDASGEKHTVTGTAPMFNEILEIDGGSALVVTLNENSKNVFSDFLPNVSFSKFLLKKFLDLRHVYSKILFYKLVNYKHRNGWIVSVDELRKDFNLDTKTKLNNFYVRLNDYAADVVATGYFKSINPVFHRESAAKNSPVVAIEFKVVPVLASFNESKSNAKAELKTLPEQITVVTKKIKTTTVFDPENQLPKLCEIPEFIEKTVKCPLCRGNVVHWVDKHKNDCFACSNSKYWANRLNKECEASCNFFASTADVESLSEKNLKGSYEKIHDWLIDNKDVDLEARKIIKEDYGDGNYFYRGNITPAMEQHNERLSKGISDKMDDDSPFPDVFFEP